MVSGGGVKIGGRRERHQKSTKTHLLHHISSFQRTIQGSSITPGMFVGIPDAMGRSGGDRRW